MSSLVGMDLQVGEVFPCHKLMAEMVWLVQRLEQKCQKGKELWAVSTKDVTRIANHMLYHFISTAGHHGFVFLPRLLVRPTSSYSLQSAVICVVVVKLFTDLIVLLESSGIPVYRSKRVSSGAQPSYGMRRSTMSQRWRMLERGNRNHYAVRRHLYQRMHVLCRKYGCQTSPTRSV